MTGHGPSVGGGGGGGDDTSSLASRKTHSRGPSLGAFRNIANKFKNNRDSGDQDADHSFSAGHDGLPATAAADGSQIAERDQDWDDGSSARPPATAPATMTEAEHPLPPLPSKPSSDMPRAEASQRPSHSSKSSVAAAAALAIPHAAGVIGGAPGGAQTVHPPPPPASSKNGQGRVEADKEDSASLLTPLYNYMQHRERSQRRTVGIAFTAAGVCAVLTAHLGQQFTRTAFFCALLGIFVIGYVLTKQLEREAGDDRYIVDAQVRQILLERGFSIEEIAQLESGQSASGGDKKDVKRSRESVEWVNSILALVWPVIGPDYFAPFVDLMEDALMQQVPGIVHSARVNDLDQGSLPLRLKSFVVLPPEAEAFLAVEEDPTKVKNAPRKPADSAQNVGAKSQQFSQGADADEIGDTGDYINLEVDFVYRAPSTVETRGKSNKTGDFEEDAIVPDEVVVQKGKEKIQSVVYVGISAASDSDLIPTVCCSIWTLASRSLLLSRFRCGSKCSA